MTTEHSLITYYTHRLSSLVEAYGDRLPELSAEEKFQLISFIGFWQKANTKWRSLYGEPFSIAEAIEDFHYELAENVLGCLRHFANASDDDVLGLTIAIAHQLKEGAYLQ